MNQVRALQQEIVAVTRERGDLLLQLHRLRAELATVKAALNVATQALAAERHKREACEVLIRDLQKELAASQSVDERRNSAPK